MRILVLEPYYGGSHKAFLTGLMHHLPYAFDLLTLPAHGWKWRMRLAAPHFAGVLTKDPHYKARSYDRILCSSLVDVAALRGLLPANLHNIPLLTYFHENQFAYPMQLSEARDVHFGLTNLTTALASDGLAFNSQYNLASFLAGCKELLAKMPDMSLAGYEATIRAKAIILYPGLDFSEIDVTNHGVGPQRSNNHGTSGHRVPQVAASGTAIRTFVRELDRSPQDVVPCGRLQIDSCHDERQAGRAPVLVWNHRWEHDKNPELFFNTLYDFAGQGIPFGLIVLGQSFRQQPPVFAQAAQRLARHMLHFGYAADRREYCRLLCQGDIVVSSANHEFYGMAVLEAVRAGCRPLVPDRLSYRELFAPAFRYEDAAFVWKLREVMEAKRLRPQEAHALTSRFSWPELAGSYRQWFEALG